MFVKTAWFVLVTKITKNQSINTKKMLLRKHSRFPEMLVYDNFAKIWVNIAYSE